MAFWKKSEDPWDMKPKSVGTVNPVTPDRDEEPETLMDSLKAWNETRKEEKERKKVPLPPMTCPWCGKEMEPAYLNGGRDGVYWHKERPEVLFGNLEAERLDTDGTFWNRYKLAWYCPACRKLAADLPDAPDTPESRTQQEYEEELRRYAEQAKQREGEH